MPKGSASISGEVDDELKFVKKKSPKIPPSPEHVAKEEAKWAATQKAKVAAAASSDLNEDEDGYEDEVIGAPPSLNERTTPLGVVIIDFLDEHGRLIFGGVVILVLTCTLLPTLYVLGMPSRKQEKDGTGVQEPAGKSVLDSKNNTPTKGKAD
jgi:hypothetical protein